MKEPITLATLASATEQEVFDQVAGHLLKQGKRSSVMPKGEGGSAPEEKCLYRGPDGLQCAAGCLIGDDEYEISFEGLGWRGVVNTGKCVYAHKYLIDGLQSLHDYEDPADWAAELTQLAQRYDLNDEVVIQHSTKSEQTASQSEDT